MSDSALFLDRVIAARRAAWLVFLVAVGVQIFTYLAFLGMERGWLDGLIESGLYGGITPDEATRLMFLYTVALKLMSTAILMGALFLTLWVRGLRRIG
ncbi:MAG: hypothetical protein CMJ89_03135 [Planctomycetes bacterium]|jgi:hypothetical protein|nr:hypothetical protein [Planctomycetota bacterium]